MNLSVDLSIPQSEFVFANDRFPAMVAGFGCVHPDTKIHTEFGLMRIADITSPIRVLSWNKKDQKFQLSLSGGAFPKGKANLLRVITPQGEFVASEHHHIFSSDHKYLSVQSLSSKVELNLASPDLDLTKLVSDLKSLPSNEQSWTQKDADYLGRYADEARLYGLSLLLDQDSGLAYAPLLTDAHISLPCSDYSFSLNKDGRWVRKQVHNHPYLFFSQSYKHHSFLRKMILAFYEVSRIATLPLEHTLAYLRKAKRSLSRFVCHRNTVPLSFAVHSFDSPLTKTPIIQVLGEESSAYYDMQVLDTNNYVCEHGFIHHNSGKTNAGIWRILRLKFQYPKLNVAWYLPTYDLISKIAYPRFAEILGENNIEYQLNKQDNILHLAGGQVIFRTLDAPERIVGYEVADSVVDELDTLPMEKAKNAWRAIIARNRQKKPDGEVNTVGVTTTPEGFKFVYERWERNPTEGYRIIRASTLSNAHNLPADYIQTLTDSYPANLLEAYLNGHFVNMTQGSVYPDFNRYDNYCDSEIKAFEPLHFGMDFNVGNTSAVGFVYRNQDPHSVIEFTKVLDTPAMITILTRLKNEGHPIYIYPDASGNWRKSNNASQSDLSLLRNAGFTVLVNSRNPQIRDRVLAVNNLIHNNGVRRLKVNTDRCPSLTESFERQAYDTNGDPDKKSGLDHVIDGAGYFLSYKHPIQGIAVQRMKLMGL